MKILLGTTLILISTTLAIKTAPQAVMGSIQGTVTNSLSLQPLANVQISLIGPNAASPVGTMAQPQAISEQNGNFIISNLSPGIYTVSAQLDGYFGPDVNGTSPSIVRASVNVAATQSNDVAFKLVPGGTISGSVLDEAGLPAINVSVQALPLTYPNGLPTAGNSGARATDDRGTFRLYGLMPGEYYVAANPALAIGSIGGRAAVPNAPASISARVGAAPAPARTYFPSALDLSQASLIKLHAGEEIAGTNIRIKTVTGARISGQVISAIPASEMILPAQAAQPGPVTAPIASLTLYLHDKNALQDPDSTISASTSIGIPADGHFEMISIPPGVYDLYANLPDIQGYGPAQPPGHAVSPVAFGRATIDMYGGNLDGVNITVHHGIDINGHVTIDGGLSTSINNVRISLQADDSAASIPVYQQVGRFQPTIDPDGSFTIPAVPEAHYRFQITFGAPEPPASGNGIRGVVQAASQSSAPARPASLPTSPLAGPMLGLNSYVADVLQSGLSVYDSGIFVGAQGIEPLDVRVKTDGGSVGGIVRGKNQIPAEGATVVLVPPESHQQNTALFKVATSDASGHFSMTGIRPGEYKLLAWDSIPQGAYLNADILKNYNEKQISVSVFPSIHLETQLTLISAQR